MDIPSWEDFDEMLDNTKDLTRKINFLLSKTDAPVRFKVNNSHFYSIEEAQSACQKIYTAEMLSMPPLCTGNLAAPNIIKQYKLIDCWVDE